MGLDISFYKNISPINACLDQNGNAINPETGDEIGGKYFQPIKNFYFDHDEGIADHCAYSFESEAGFRAGSYGGYNHWRDQLAQIAGYPKDESEIRPYSASAWKANSGPFWELINFSDCEGTIGPENSAKLAKDFADFQSKADEHQDEYFRERYSLWRNAFETASQNGAVVFH